MLTDERKMTEGEGILVLGAQSGLGRQCVAALMRLGQRVLVHLPATEEAAKLQPLTVEILRSKEAFPTAEELTPAASRFRSIVLIPSHGLSSARSLEEAEFQNLLKFAEDSGRVVSNAKFVLVLSAAENSHRIETLRQKAPAATIFLAPVVIGFRDEGFFDAVLEGLTKGRLPRIPKSLQNKQIPLSFSTDVAALVVAALRRDPLYAGVVRVRENAQGLEKVLSSVGENLPPPSPLQKILNWVPGTHSEIPLLKLNPDLLSAATVSTKAPYSDELFPAPPSSVERVVRQSIELWKKDPQMGLHFPPSRAL